MWRGRGAKCEGRTSRCCAVPSWRGGCKGPGTRSDVAKLLEVLFKLRVAGNTVLVIEHNLDVIKTADWVIDLGPEGGAGGGAIVAQGPPEQIATAPQSHTGRYLKSVLTA